LRLAGQEAQPDQIQPTFKIQAERNVVLVRAVVRDSKGNPVKNLRKEDFQVYDSGKLQTVTHFAVEEASPPKGAPLTTSTGAPAERYVGLFFDDIHTSFEDLARSRVAAERYLDAALPAGNRIGVFTSSGQQNLDFTDQRAPLHDALLKLRPWLMMAPTKGGCPNISPYQAYLMTESVNQAAVEVATEETLMCLFQEESKDADAQDVEIARGRAMDVARTVFYTQRSRADAALVSLAHIVRRMASLPGQRTILVTSSGFLYYTLETRVNEVIDRAVRANIIINALDAKGLYVSSGVPDARTGPRELLAPSGGRIAGEQFALRTDSVGRLNDALSSLAQQTGGRFFENNNDLAQGFATLGELPETAYLLEFSTPDLKYNGRFHPLKVTLVAGKGLTVQARRGYYAPQRGPSTRRGADQEIQEALRREDEWTEIPLQVDVQIQNNNGSKILVVRSHIDLSPVLFRKEKGGNLNTLTVVTGLFDKDRKYLDARKQIIELQLHDEDMPRALARGANANVTFEAKAGTYTVRQVVREAKGGQMATLNRMVRVPD